MGPLDSFINIGAAPGPRKGRPRGLRAPAPNTPPPAIASVTGTLFTPLRAWLFANYKLRRNTISLEIEDDGRALKEKDLLSLWIAACEQVDKKVTEAQVRALLASDEIPNYNPLHEFFEKHKGRPNVAGSIARLAASVHTDTGGEKHPKFFEHFLYKWLLGLVGCAYGDPSPLVLVLVGGQNTGKSEFFERLLPGEIRRTFFADSKLDAGKDDELLMTQKWLIRDDEMGGKSKRDNARLKHLTSAQFFSLRAPYARANADYKRLALLCGTSNEKDLLTDGTGNRRIIPINVLSRDFAAFDAIDKTDVLVGAWLHYQHGQTHHLTSADIALLNSNTDVFEAVVPERELLLQYYEQGDPLNKAHFMTTSGIRAALEHKSGTRLLNLRTLGIHLKSLGYPFVSVRIDGKPIWGYYLKERDTGNWPEKPPASPF